MVSTLKATLVVSTCLFTGLVLVLLSHHRERLHLPNKGKTDSRVGQQLSLNYQMSTLQLTSTPSVANTTTIYRPSITTTLQNSFVLTLLWVISDACSGASIIPNVVSAAIWTWP